MKRSPLRKHANEQPADQIAAEAASEIMANYVPASSADRANIDGIQTVILSAIEKARKLQMDEDDAMWSAKLEAESLAAHGTSAAAHASEECVICGGTRIKGHKQDCPNYEPAHASEQSVKFIYVGAGADDTKRLDWLETWGNKQNAISWIGMALTTSTLREAIDAAMQKEKE